MLGPNPLVGSWAVDIHQIPKSYVSTEPSDTALKTREGLSQQEQADELLISF